MAQELAMVKVMELDWVKEWEWELE